MYKACGVLFWGIACANGKRKHVFIRGLDRCARRFAVRSIYIYM